MGAKTVELLHVLDDINLLLAEDGEHRWHDYLLEVKRRLKASDASGITMLSNEFGGMGSINDLVLAYDVPVVPGPVV